jgi:PAS domain S-box-containing protein
MVATTVPTPQLAPRPAGASVAQAAACATAPQRLISLRLKLGMLLGTVAALAVAIPTILHALAFVGDQERKVGEDNLELARVVGVLTEWRIEQTFALLELVTTAPGFATDIANGNAQRLTDRLGRAVHTDDDLSSVMVIDRDGTVIAHSLDDKRLLGQSATGWPTVLAALQTGRPGLGRAIQSPVTERAVVPLAAAARNANGEIVGAVIAYLALDDLEARVNGARGPGRGLARIVDGDGRMLTSPDPGLELSDVSAASNPVIALALAGSPSVGRVRSASGDLAYAAAIPIQSGWVVEVEHPTEAVLAPLCALIVRTVLIALAAFVIAMLVGVAAAHRIAEPLLALLRALRSIRREEGRPRLPRSSTTEVAWLADELEMMRSALELRTVETHQAVDALARYRLLTERTTDIVIFMDDEYTIVEANAAAESAHGYTRAELIGRRVRDLVADPAFTLSDEEIARARTDGLRFETTHRRADGSTFPVEVTLISSNGLDAGPDAIMMAIIRDVAERRHAEAVRSRMLVREQEARASEERAAEVTGIVQHMPCGVVVFDTQGCLTLANERALEMLSPDSPPDAGDDDAAATVPPPRALLDERLLNPCRALVARALGGSVVSDRELHISPDGCCEDGRGTRGIGDDDHRILIGSAAPLRSARGQVRGAVAILTDVTRERRLVQDLISSEGTLRHSLESLLVLHEAGRALSSTLVEEEIGARFAESCVRIGRLDAALVFLGDARGEVQVLGTHGDPVLIEHVLVCPEERAARQRALAEGVAADAGDGAEASRGAGPACAEMSLAIRRHIELSARGRTLGILEIYGSEQLASVTEDALASLAAHAVSAFENAHLYHEVWDREQRLQDALRQLLIAQEEERRRVAYELHDGLAQVAAATHMSLQTFAAQYRPRSPQTRQQLEKSVELARRVVREARQVIAGLRPTTLDDFGLERALRLYVQELVSDGWTIEYDPQPGLDRLPGPIETVLYRIAQEALTNIRKHAETLTATITLRREAGRVELEVVDRGAGFKQAPVAPDDDPGHRVGLVGMRERAALVGGVCTIESEPGCGTRVLVRIPLPAAPTAALAAPKPAARAPAAPGTGAAPHAR